MTIRRPPLMSQGQANDFYSYMGIGTGLMWLAGGVAAGPAALALGLCGLGAVRNNTRRPGQSGTWPAMVFQPPDTSEPGPLSNPDWPQEAYDYLARYERELQQEFGINAVYCYRRMIVEGHSIIEGYDELSALLRALKAEGRWQNGRIQSGNHSPKQILDQLTGRTVASDELQKYMNSGWLTEFYKQFCVRMENKHGRSGSESRKQRCLIDFSLIIYILGTEPICDKPVRRIKYWPGNYVTNDTDPGPRLYYVADGLWFYNSTVNALRGRWEIAIKTAQNFFGQIPPHLLDEAESLWDYRVEYHMGEEPPGHPGTVSLSNIFFGRDIAYPATEEDLIGMP